MTVTTSPFQPLGGFNLGTGASSLMGQGTEPELWALWSFSGVQTDPPVWVNLEPTRVRDFSVSRGRESELQEFDAGTATVTLDNQDRAFDPLYASGPYYPNVRPRNRVWLRGQFNAATYDIFKGYAESYDQQQPAPGFSDALAVVSASDELKLLNLRKTAAFDPADSPDYTGVVGADNPSHVWRWRDPFLTTTTIVDSATGVGTAMGPPVSRDMGDMAGHGLSAITHTAVVEGPGWRVTGAGYGQSSDTPILGLDVGSTEAGGAGPYGCLLLTFAGTADQLTSTDQSAGDMAQKTTGTVECWFKKTANPGSTGGFWASPEVSGVAAVMWQFQVLTTGAVRFNSRVSGAVTLNSDSAVLNNDTWYHLCAVRDGTNQILYVNGVNVAQAASTAAWEKSSATVFMYVQNPGTGVTVSLAEQAVYPGNGLSPTRVLANYTAGTGRGYPVQDPGPRVNAVLDSVTNHAPRLVRAGTRDMTAAFTANQTVLNHVRAATVCEAPEGLFFCGQDGTLTFLDAAHRTVAPWNTIQVIWADDATANGVPYLDFDSDYSDSWIANIWNVSKARQDSVMQTVSDATSISRYDEISQTISDLSLRVNADAATIASAYLAKYKDPITRGNNLTMSSAHPDACNAFLSLDLADRIRVIRTLPNGLGWFDQELFVQKIEVSGSNDQSPWQMSLHVSPL